MSAKLSSYLQLASLHFDPWVASLLPFNIARKYHAVPIAADGKRITVAMANPDDPTARKAVFDSLGPETCVVQAKPLEIESVLNEFWLPSISSKQHFMSWSPTKLIATKVEPYAHAFAQLLGARLTSRTNVDIGQCPSDALVTDIQCIQPDLIILHRPVTLFPIWKTSNSIKTQRGKKIPVSLLFVCKPHYLLRNILLVLHDLRFDTLAIQWAAQIASKSGAAITVLPILIPILPVHIVNKLEQRSPIDLSSYTCFLGETLRQVAQHLARQNIQGVLRLRQGTLINQIQQEIRECEHDFIVIAADIERSTVHWLMCEQINQLQSLSEMPILIAKSVKQGHL